MIEDRIKALLGEFHWTLLLKDQQIEELQKELKELKEKKDGDNS